MGHYRRLAIETYRNPGEPSAKDIRARPLPGQGISTSLKVECSSSMRTSHPVGTVFVIQGQMKQKEGGRPFIYTSWQWKYEVVDRDTAVKRIAAGKL